MLSILCDKCQCERDLLKKLEVVNPDIPVVLLNNGCEYGIAELEEIEEATIFMSALPILECENDFKVKDLIDSLKDITETAIADSIGHYEVSKIDEYDKDGEEIQQIYDRLDCASIPESLYFLVYDNEEDLANNDTCSGKGFMVKKYYLDDNRFIIEAA